MPAVAAITNPGVFWLAGLILLVLILVYVVTPWLEKCSNCGRPITEHERTGLRDWDGGEKLRCPR